MILVATILIMLVCVYSQYRNGLFTSFAMLIMVLISGLIAFGFWEPIADFLDPIFQNNSLAGCEDMIVLTLLFSVSLFALRLAIVYANPDLIEEHGTLQHFGGAAIGAVTGYLVAGFLVCVLQTLPLDEHFMDFEPRSAIEPAYRSFFPGDRVWLALMRHAGAGPVSWKMDDPDAVTALDRYSTFDRSATFELRYMRYRRGFQGGAPMPYVGEFDRDLGKQKLR